MASPQSNAIAEMYRGWVADMAANPDMSIEDLRRVFGHWGDVTADPTWVDYSEIEIDGFAAMWAVPKGAAMDRVLLCSHGGGCVVGSMYTHRKMFGHIAKATGCRALIVDYRLAPENPHPGPVNDMVTAYRWLLEVENIKPEHIAFTGDSAGGKLALTTIAAAKAQGLPIPAATMPMSPWAGLELSGETYDTNKDRDALVSRDTTIGIGGMFIGEHGDPKHPLGNLLYTDYSGFPPIYIQVGEAETLLDDARRTAALATKAGAEVKIDIFDDMQHVFHFMAGNAPEADDAIAKMASWVRPRLGLS